MHRVAELNRAIHVAIATGAAGFPGTAAAQATGEQPATRRAVEEVVVTATKRAASLQDIPLTVRALGAERLATRDINTFSEYVKELPNVTFAGRGPGQNEVYIRGVASARGSLFLAGGVGAGPTVAFYVDEAPLTSAGRNLDVYVTDVARIEVLAGPQGTLYGASSQAGTLRLITGRPDLDEIDAGVELSLSTTRDGDQGRGIEGFVNLPIVENRFAVRLVGYNVDYGGYIDNVPGSLSFAINEALGSSIPMAPDAELRVAANDAFVEDDFNDSSYSGGRITGKLAVNEDWDVTVGYMTQELEADGVFDYSPEVGDLEVIRFTPDWLEDRFDQVNWTVEGRIAALDVVYTGSFLNREVDQRIDYVGVTGESWQPFYNCAYNDMGEVTVCAAPDQNFHGIQDSDDTQHEFRVATDAAGPWSLIAGVYYDKSEAGVSQEWEYHSPQIDGIEFAPNAPHSEATHFDPETRNPEVAFFNDLRNEAQQLAFFGELTYRLTDAWSATVGLRRYHIDIVPRGSYNPATFGAEDADDGGALDDFDPADENDTIGKLTVDYRLNDDVLLYGTISEGFRRGGFNRGGDVFDVRSGEFAYPAYYESDTVNNYELGWKTTLADGRLRFNGSAYYIDWSDIQIDIFDAETYGFLLFTANVGEAEIRGLEGDFSFLATDDLTLYGAFSLNDTELTGRPPGADNLVPASSELALTPSFQGNLSLRYDFRIAGHDAWVQASAQHRGDTFTSISVAIMEDLDAYTMGDVSFGLSVEGWDVRASVSNVSDERPELFISNQDAVTRTVTSRPRTLTLKVSRSF